MQKLYIFFGMIASGKTSLAIAFAAARGYSCYNTDRVRKELAGADPFSRCGTTLNQGIYSREFSRKTYKSLLDKAAVHLNSGEEGVVLDGSYHSRKERDRVRNFAVLHRVGVVFILCACSEKEVKRRLARRANDPDAVSDGSWEIYVAQKKIFQQPDELRPSELYILDTEEKPDILLADLLAKVAEKQP